MKEFSKGFIDDMAKLLLLCAENDTDNLEINIPFNGGELNVEICFSFNKDFAEGGAE